MTNCRRWRPIWFSTKSPSSTRLTHLRTLSVEVGPKRLELARELFPGETIVALLVTPANPLAATISKDSQAVADTLGVRLHDCGDEAPRVHRAYRQRTRAGNPHYRVARGLARLAPQRSSAIVGRPVIATFQPVKLDGYVSSLDLAFRDQTPAEPVHVARVRILRATAQEPHHRHRRLLRARRERPGSRRAAEKRDELAPLHSMTSSARA